MRRESGRWQYIGAGAEDDYNGEREKKMVILRTLLENNLSRNRALVAEHGLSFLVETDDKKILFDCCHP